MYIIRHILENNNIRKEEIMSNMFESLKEVFNKRWFIRSVSLGLSVVVLGGVLLRTPKSYGNDGIMSLGEFYELELNLDNNNSSGEDDIYNDSDSSYDYDYDYDYDNSDYDYDYDYDYNYDDDEYNYDEYNYGDYDYDDYDYDYNDYSYSNYEDYFEDNDYDYDYDYGTNDYSYVLNPRRRLRSISNSGNNRFDFIVKFLNYAFFECKLDCLDHLNVKIVREFLNLYGMGKLPNDVKGRT